MKTFYFNSGVKPWNTDINAKYNEGNKFINGELHHPFMVPDSVPDNAKLHCLMDSAYEHYSEENFIIAPVLGGNMHSKFAVFKKPLNHGYMNIFAISTTAYSEEDFQVMTTLNESEIVSVIEPIVKSERDGEVDYDNLSLIREIKKAYPSAQIKLVNCKNITI